MYKTEAKPLAVRNAGEVQHAAGSYLRSHMDAHGLSRAGEAENKNLRRSLKQGFISEDYRGMVLVAWDGIEPPTRFSIRCSITELPDAAALTSSQILPNRSQLYVSFATSNKNEFLWFAYRGGCGLINAQLTQFAIQVECAFKPVFSATRVMEPPSRIK